MMIASNIHTHTNLCDGANTAEAMAEEAYNKSFISFGFSAHSALPYKNDFALTHDNEKIYIKAVNDLKLKYQNKMEVLLGLELDADSPLPQYNYDFLISSVHQLHPNGNCFAIDDSAEIFERLLSEYKTSFEMAVDFYTNTVSASLRDRIDVIGHFDLLTKFNEGDKYFSTADKDYRALACDTIDAIIQKRPDIVFEINTGAMSRGYRTTPYPDAFFLKYLGDRNARVMINSDAHSVSTIDFAFDKAVNYCFENGIKTIYRLRKNGFEPIKIESL